MKPSGRRRVIPTDKQLSRCISSAAILRASLNLLTVFATPVRSNTPKFRTISIIQPDADVRVQRFPDSPSLSRARACTRINKYRKCAWCWVGIRRRMEDDGETFRFIAGFAFERWRGNNRLNNGALRFVFHWRFSGLRSLGTAEGQRDERYLYVHPIFHPHAITEKTF